MVMIMMTDETYVNEEAHLSKLFCQLEDCWVGLTAVCWTDVHCKNWVFVGNMQKHNKQCIFIYAECHKLTLMALMVMTMLMAMAMTMAAMQMTLMKMTKWQRRVSCLTAKRCKDYIWRSCLSLPFPALIIIRASLILILITHIVAHINQQSPIWILLVNILLPVLILKTKRNYRHFYTHSTNKYDNDGHSQWS